MAELLSLRGRAALSPFRINKLLQGLSAVHSGPAIADVTATYWHFVEIARALASPEQDKLARLLTYGPRAEEKSATGTLFLVVPRPGTISPWSSKATDIARNCGLDAVVRIERGTAWYVADPAIDDARLLPSIHDRMTEDVLDSFEAAGALFDHVAPRPQARVPLLAQG